MTIAKRRILCGLLALATAAWASAQSHDFSFFHISDTHFSPHVAGQPQPGIRGEETIGWICRESAEAQNPPAGEMPAPAFVVVTGDVFEYGVIDDTARAIEQAFGCFKFPVYMLPGNHDNTWHAVYALLRERYGGENYAFTHGGCRFLCISSASPQEPVPSIDGKTRAWLKRVLDATPADVPIFIALHHPPNDRTFAPAEYPTLIDMLRDHNVVLLLYGHGHSVNHAEMDGIDGVMGGSTWGPNAGYGLVDVSDKKLRVLYHFHEPRGEGEKKKEWRKVLTKAIPASPPPRLFSLELPDTGGAVFRGTLNVRLKTAKDVGLSDVAIQVDGQDCATEPVGEDQHDWHVSVSLFVPGQHTVSVRAESETGREDIRAATFSTADPNDWSTWRDRIPAAVKARPVIVDRRVIIARTDGVVEARDRDDGRVLWQFTAGAEILGTPALLSRTLVFGSGDGEIYALDVERGRIIWKQPVGVPVYGAPVIADDTVYIGDNSGRLHALDITNGQPRWTYTRADFGIEARPCIWDNLVVFGAWDGRIYAVKRSTGDLAWKAWGPRSAESGSRYYAPADCEPVVLGDRLYVCDRGYALAAYDKEGQQVAKIADKVSAIATYGDFLYARTTDNRMLKFDAQGEKVWAQDVPAGRFPIPPTCTKDSVIVCSNAGTLSVLDAAKGTVRWQYQVTPAFYVMAGVGVDSAGYCYTAGMDGTLMRVRPTNPNAVKPLTPTTVPGQ